MDEKRPMRPNPAALFEGTEIHEYTRPREGVKVAEMVMDHAALEQIGPMALQAAVERMGREVAERHRPEIEKVVHEYVFDREWAEPVIREAIYRAVREVVAEILKPEDG